MVMADPSDLGHGKNVISASPDSQVEVGPWNVDGQPSLAICGECNERDMLLQTKH